MKTPPESYLIFREELAKEKAEKQRLRKEYEATLDELTGELNYLREQIAAQHTMIETAVAYATRLEKEIFTLKQQVQETTSPNRSYH